MRIKWTQFIGAHVCNKFSFLSTFKYENSFTKTKISLCQTESTSFATRAREILERFICSTFESYNWKWYLAQWIELRTSVEASFQIRSKLKVNQALCMKVQTCKLIELNWIELCILVPKSNVQRRKLAWQSSSQCTSWLAGNQMRTANASKRSTLIHRIVNTIT